MRTTIKIADTTAIYSDLVAAFVAGNRAGDGTAWSPADGDSVLYRAASDDEVDVVVRNGETWLVGDVHGPWAVRFAV